ncbi:fumarylacetoacetate hydrolase family protein [Arthrobacter sp. KNU40]|uniref:fumarylacetoacetate hydrolase family protein n=1 Tax=Arthrobacter sp. KNU40 TaxID=3447965 RepID=UPI003F5F2701
MRFARLGPAGSEIPVLLQNGHTYGLTPVTTDIDSEFWTTGGPDRVRAALEAGELKAVDDAESLRIGAPIARPSAIVCVGMNYVAHAAESGSAPPEVPIIFLKPPNTVVGPYDDVQIPRGATKTDWEVELGIVIGRRASYLSSPDESMDHIAGFVAANDLSERSFQLEISGGQWSKGKSAAGFCPAGPWLVTPDELDHRALSLRSWVNGEPRQDSNTKDMIFSVEHLVHDLSQYLVLEPGDLILTGTPQGVGFSGKFPYLVAGDVMEIEIDGLGRQHQKFVTGEVSAR